MKKKKWLYIGLLLLLVGPILFFYQAFNGNPVSKYFSKTTLENYLSETYPEHEYSIRETFYNFKIGGYTLKVVQIGEHQSEEYEFEVTGFLKPAVTHDGIYYANLDLPLMEKLSEEAASELTALLQEMVPVHDLFVQVETLKGKYEDDQAWSKNLVLEQPIYIHITIDATQMDKQKFLSAVQSIQQTLDEGNYNYSRISLNGNLFDKVTNDNDNGGYVKYAIGIDKDEKARVQDIEEIKD